MNLNAAALFLMSSFLSVPYTFAEPVPADIPQVCAEVGAYQQKDLGETLSTLVQTGTAQEIYSASWKHWEIDVVPWIVSMSLRKEARKAAYAFQLQRATQFAFLGVHPGMEVPSPPTDTLIPDFHELKAYLKYFSENSVELPSDIRARIEATISSYSVDSRIAQLSRDATALCLKYKTWGCSEALKDALSIMSPRSIGVAYVSLPNEVTDIFSDASYIIPLSKAALRMNDKIEAAENGAPVIGDVFTDLKEAFLDSGFSEDQASERTWKILGFYSTRGASMEVFTMESYFRYNENTPIHIPLFVISAAMNYLDTLSEQANVNYSYPSGVKTSCKMGKPYHFWNAAYISHRLMREGHSAKLT